MKASPSKHFGSRYLLSALIPTIFVVCTTFAEPGRNGNVDTQISELLRELKSPRFSEREEATVSLWSFGNRALPALKRAAGSEDPELASRASSLVKNIVAGISPDTPPEVTKLIEEYSTKSLDAKTGVLRTLLRKGAYRYMVYLLAWEENEEHKIRLLSNYKGVAISAARQAIANDKIDNAIAMLELIPEEEANRRALAFLLKRTGRIAEYLENTTETPDIDFDRYAYLWKLSSQLPEIQELALANKDSEGYASASLLKGDPAPTLQVLSGLSEDLYFKHGIACLRDLSKGRGKETVRRANPLPDFIASDKIVDRRKVAAYLRTAFVNGFIDEAEQMLPKISPASALEYFDSQERPIEALESVGIKTDHGIPTNLEPWLKRSIGSVIKGTRAESDQHEIMIVQVAGLFHARGCDEISSFILEKYLSALADEGLDRWYAAATKFSAMVMGDEIAAITLKRGNEDNQFHHLISNLCDNAIEIEILWQFFPARKRPLEQNFTDMLALMGVVTADIQYIRDLERALLHLAKDGGANRYREVLQGLAFAALLRNDLREAFEFFKQLAGEPEVSRKPEWVEKYRMLSFDLMKWKDVVLAGKLVPPELSSSIVDVVKLGIAYRKVGREERGDVLINDAVTYTLMTPVEYNKAAFLLFESGYVEEAADLWKDCLLTYGPSDWEFHYVVQYLGSFSGYYEKQKDWTMASAIALAEAGLGIQAKSPETDPRSLLNYGFRCYFFGGMTDINEGKETLGTRKLQTAHSFLDTDGILADDFFPNVVGGPAGNEAENWFSQSFKKLEAVIDVYPESHNTMNTAAWLASRSKMSLDQGLVYARRAIELKPGQGAYLDTLAEIHFANQDGQSAVKWSEQAVKSMISGEAGYGRSYMAVVSGYHDLRNQLQRFRGVEN